MSELKIRWFGNPHQFSSVDFSRFYDDTETTSMFENDGDGHSKYFYAYDKRLKRYRKAGKVIKNLVVFPVLFSLSELLYGLLLMVQWMNGHSALVMSLCVYLIMFLVGYYFFFEYGEETEMVHRWM